MKIKSFKCTCGHDDFFFADKGNQTGIYCSSCGKWFKWADKDEKNLQLKSQSVAEVLDKISAEIKDLHNSHMINFVSADGAVDTCLEIIEKYKGDSK